MAEVGFEEDIEPILRPYAACMKGLAISTRKGLVVADLLDYATVRELSKEIIEALHGHRPGSTAPHPMPPAGPLPDEKIALFVRWVDAGMPARRS